MLAFRGIIVWPAGLVVWFSLRVREVTGSIPVWALFSHIFLDWDCYFVGISITIIEYCTLFHNVEWNLLPINLIAPFPFSILVIWIVFHSLFSIKHRKTMKLKNEERVRTKRSNIPLQHPSYISVYNPQSKPNTLQWNRTHHILFLLLKYIILQRNLLLSLYLITCHIELLADLRTKRQQLHLKHAIKELCQSILPFIPPFHSYQRNARIAHNRVENLLLHCNARRARQRVFLDTQEGRRLDDLIAQTHRPPEDFTAMYKEALELCKIAVNARLGHEAL